MDHLKFHGLTKHETISFHPKVVYGFEDPDAAPYFADGMGWAERTDEEADVIVTIGEINVDPEVRFGDGPKKGELVMPERAAQARAEKGE